ncbi:MAG TPA: septum formation initiator family protein [Actinocrinis sp.]|nr:septum formation initiator family protein [Actinocrinis sp.]
MPSELRDVRKAARRRAALRRSRPEGRPPRTRLTGRAGILALALCVVLVSVAYPLQQYLVQRSRLNALNASNAAAAQQVAKLQTQLSDWRDPAYVKLQARAQLHYVMPGEIGFTLPDGSILQEPIGIPSPTGQPWYQNLWSTVASPSAKPAPAATASPDPSSVISQHSAH